MNKKFSTLMVAALLTTGINVGAQTISVGDATTDGIYTTKGVASSFSAFTKDNASWDGTFPIVSAFPLSIANGAKPIAQLDNVDKGKESKYFQIVVGDNSDGKEVLTMVWVKASNRYELNIENVDNANSPLNPIRLDRTLWEVRATKDPVSTVVYYTLINKATQMTLQISQNGVTSFTASGKDYKEASIAVVDGQTNWRWADGAVASEKSAIATTENVLKNAIRSSFSSTETVYLAMKKDLTGSNSVTLSALVANNNDPLVAANAGVKVTNTSVAEYTPIIFEAWEANPIVLTADQINAELGYDRILVPGERTDGYFNFYFKPDAEGNVNGNKLINKNLVALKPEAGETRLPGQTPDGFVRFVTKDTKDKTEFERQFLRVDTAYHDPGLSGRYDLQLTVDRINYPRYAVAADNMLVNSNGELTDIGGNVLNIKQRYGDANTGVVTSVAPNTMKAYVELQRQSNFRPIFYPSTQSLRLQAEMMYKAGKAALNATGAGYQPWWQQMATDAQAATVAAGVTTISKGMLIAPCAADPSKNPVAAPDDAVGYYPAYTQTLAAAAAPAQGMRVLQYKLPYGIPNVAKGFINGYVSYGDKEAVGAGAGAAAIAMWNAVANLTTTATTTATTGAIGTPPASTDWATGNYVTGTQGANVLAALVPASVASNAATMKVSDPGMVATAATDPGQIQANYIFGPLFSLAHNNVVKLVTLTTGHQEVTADVHDINDTKYNGLLTYISLVNLKEYSDVANIPAGFYYIRNANKINTGLMKAGDYRYEDLAATNATFTFWNAMTKTWDIAQAGTSSPATTSELNGDMHKLDRANKGNLVYSEDKKDIPSAQFYIDGNGGYYTMYNRESQRVWNTSYWWATNEPDVFVNMATYTDGSGLQQTYRDTIRIEAVPAAVLADTKAGYLNISQDIAKADTSVYTFKFNALGDTELFLSEASDLDPILKVMKESKGQFKLERVRMADKDLYSQEMKGTDDLYYGMPAAKQENNLVRAKYYIYKDEVNSNSGEATTGIKTREYITMESGKYRLSKVTVKVEADGYTTSTDDKVIAGSKADSRRAFYVKQFSTVNPDQYVLVDPLVVNHDSNNTGSDSFGARAFVNQLTAEVQPAGLVSTAAANAADNSVFSLEKVQAFNYRDIRPAGVDRDTVEFFSAKTDGQYLLSENTVKGANVGLLESLDKRLNKNNAMFLDTANVNHVECPRFLIGLRSKDSVEISNLDKHNHHLFTDADYLINMVDSATTNKAYVYQNQDFNQTKYYRLGFIRARHQGSTLKFEKSGKTFDLSDATLGTNKLNIATFAFRYANTNRDDFYIETMYDANTKGWLKTINHVLVVTPNIQEAEVFSFKKSEQAPTSNDQITASEVSVIAGNGVVTVKNAAGKSVVVNNILGQTIASTVLTSDDATIAVPAGIVVVAVDGEEAVKTVVK